VHCHTIVLADTLHLFELNVRTIVKVRIVGMCVVRQTSIQTPQIYRNE
jgi:hypothetical protein